MVIQSRALAAYRRDSPVPTFEEIEETVGNRAQNIVAKTHSGEINAIREYCQTSARPVYIQKVVPSKGVRRSRQVNTEE